MYNDHYMMLYIILFFYCDNNYLYCIIVYGIVLYGLRLIISILLSYFGLLLQQIISNTLTPKTKTFL